MAVWTVQVGLAVRKPPTHDTDVWVDVDADTVTDAELTAIAIASITRPGVVAVSTVVTDWPEP